MQEFFIQQFLIGRMRNFTYLITRAGASYVIDPQPNLAPWENEMRHQGAHLKGILLTHSHHDHIGGVPEIVKKYNVPIYIHKDDAHRLMTWPEAVRKKITHIHDGQLIAGIEVLHTPGHSQGESCFLIRGNDSWHLFTGDTVFVGDVGRTDLETGSTAELFKTLQRLKKLPESTIIYPGHDYGQTPTSTIGEESRRSAAFLCKTVEDLDALP